MTLFIQRRSIASDTQAIHAKLEEILLTRGELDSELAHVDDAEP